MLGLLGLLVSLDATSLAVTLPVIARELNGTTLESLWASISFLLAVAITQPIYSSVSDVLGRKLPLYTSMTLFATGSTIFALAKNMRVVIIGRLIQGFGGGGMDVLQTITISDITTLRERPLYMGVNTVLYSIGAIAGPIVGGVFTEYVTWRWFGWINLPILAICFCLGFLFLRVKPAEMGFGEKLGRLDWIGMLLFATGATCVALPLSWADSLFAWLAWQTLFPLLVGLELLAVLAWYERKPLEPVFPYRIFNNTTAKGAILSSFVHGLVMYTVVQYLPLFYQAVYLQTPLDAALSTLPFCGVLVVFSAVSGAIVSLVRRYRVVLWTGWLLMATFIGLFYLLDKDTSKAEAYSFQIMAGVGTGIVLTVTAFPIQASVQDVDDTGLAVGMTVVFRLFGGLIGLTVASTVFTTVFQQKFSIIEALPEVLTGLENSSQAIGFIPELRELNLSRESLEVLIGVYNRPFQVIWIVMTSLSGVAFVTSLFIKELTLEKDDVGRQGLQ